MVGWLAIRFFLLLEENKEIERMVLFTSKLFRTHNSIPSKYEIHEIGGGWLGPEW